MPNTGPDFAGRMGWTEQWPRGLRPTTLLFHRALHAQRWDDVLYLLEPCLSRHIGREALQRLGGDLLSEVRESPTGRIHGRCRLRQNTAEFLDLADDVRKAILFELSVEAGTQLVSWSMRC